MRILNDTTELQIRLRPDEVDGFIDMVLGATHSPIRRGTGGRNEKGVSVMTCTGFDAEAVRVCLDIEAIARKYNVGVMDVMNRVMEIHCTWEGREND